MMMGSFAIALVLFDLGDKIQLIGFMGSLSGFIVLSGWIIINVLLKERSEV